MSGNLSAFELLHRENLFIRLKNQGKNLDEIALLLDVEKELVEKWNEEFEKEMERFIPNASVIYQIEKKNRQNIYIVDAVNVISELNLDKILADLEKLSNYTEFRDLTDEQKLLLRSLNVQAKQAIDILKEYVSTIDGFIKKENGDNAIQHTSKQNIILSGDEYRKVVNVALETWMFYCYSPNILVNILIEKFSEDVILRRYNNILPYSIK